MNKEQIKSADEKVVKELSTKVSDEITRQIKDALVKQPAGEPQEFLRNTAIEMIAALEHDISISIYDEEKGHDPEAEKELEQWKSALMWLEHLHDTTKKMQPSENIGHPEDLEKEVFKEWGTTKEEYIRKSMDKVNLEMEIATYLQDWEYDEAIGLHLSTDEGCIQIELDDIRDLARHFYELGKQAQKEKMHPVRVVPEEAWEIPDGRVFAPKLKIVDDGCNDAIIVSGITDEFTIYKED